MSRLRSWVGTQEPHTTEKQVQRKKYHEIPALQGHSGSNLIDPTLQDNVVIGTGIFNYFYHVGCTFNLYSIINNELIPGGQDSSRRQTVFFLPIDPRDKDHEDPEHIDFSVPRRAQYLHSAWKKHQDAVFWIDIDLAIRKGLTFYQTRSNAIILQGTLPAYCIPKAVRLKTGEVLYEKSYMSPRPPPKISLRHDHDWTRGNDELGSIVEQQPVRSLVQQSCGEVQHATFSQLTQPKPKPICVRSGKPEDTEHVFVVKGETSRSHEIDENACTKNLALQMDRGNLRDCLKTFVLSMLTMEQGNLLSKTAQVHTQWKNNLLLKKIVTLRHTTRTTSSTVHSTRRTSTSTFQDYHILQWNNHMASTFKIWFRRSRTTLIDVHFKVIFNNIDNSILSAKNHETWLKQLETSNCVNYSMLNPKHSAKHVSRTGTSASSTAHAGTSCEMERKRTRDSSSTILTSFHFPIITSRKGDPTATATGRRKGITNSSSRIRSWRFAWRVFSWVFTTGSSVMRDSARTWLNCVAVKKYVVGWTNWRTKITRTTSLQKKLVCTETIGGSVRTLWVPTRCRWGIELISKKHCLPCDASRTKRIRLITKIGKALPHLGRTGKIPGDILHLSITATMDPALIDRGNLKNGDWANYSWNESQN